MKDLLTIAKENLPEFDKVNHLYVYGSKKRDIDMLAVYSMPVEEKLGQGRVDINAIGEENFYTKLKLRDIELTDPVVTGEAIIGGTKLPKKDPQCLDYLLRKSIESYNSADYFYNTSLYITNEELIRGYSPLQALESKEPEQQNLMLSLVNLGYSLSYALSREEYKNKDIITFEEIKPKSRLLQQVHSTIKNYQDTNKQVTGKKAQYLMKKTKEDISKLLKH